MRANENHCVLELESGNSDTRTVKHAQGSAGTRSQYVGRSLINQGILLRTVLSSYYPRQFPSEHPIFHFEGIFQNFDEQISEKNDEMR
jgi:hypothetical protein